MTAQDSLKPSDPGTSPNYTGRFAPSPTGPLHFGSLLAATASYLEAHRHQGVWQLRIDDIDPPREAPGARDSIPATLEAFGFEWDGATTFQSSHTERYQAAVDALLREDRAYPCACTRREVKAKAKDGIDGPVYPGTCQHGLPAGREGRSVRVRTDPGEVCFEDAFQGSIHVDMARDIGDFVIRRADGLFAYHLAAAVDDGAPEITHVIRGIDLLYSTPRQIHLMQALGLAVPHYGHLPVVLNREGQKLSKQTGAEGLDDSHPGPQLHAALRALAQNPPDELATAPVPRIWEWAREHWDPTPLHGQSALTLP